MEIDNLLAALDDDRVQDKLLSIMTDLGERNQTIDASTPAYQHPTSLIDVEYQQPNLSNQDKFGELQQEISALNDKLEAECLRTNTLQTQLAESERCISTLTLSNQTQSKELEVLETRYNTVFEELSTTNSKLDFYRSHFTEEVYAQDLYQSLTSQTRDSLAGIFKDVTIQGLMVCGTQEKNIANFWDYLKNEIVNGHNQDQNNLVSLFSLLFKRFNLAFPMLEPLNPDEGEMFDNQLHIKHNSSVNMSGAIKHVLLPGYVNTKTGKVIRTAIVVI